MTNLTNDVPVTEREYRKTATIRATQWHKMGDHPAVVPHQLDEGGSNGLGWINTLEGGHIVTPGDWIATGVKGEHWPIKPDIFAASYEPAARLTSQPAQSDVLREAAQAVLSWWPEGSETNSHAARQKPAGFAQDIQRLRAAVLIHPATETQSDAVREDVRKLVIAARNLAFSDHRPAGAPETQAEVELIELFAELDRAIEVFADRIEWHEAADTGGEA